jgi:hypothetical protein
MTRGESFMPHRRRRSIAPLVVAVACTALAACYQQPQYVEPPAPRALTITAQHKQSQRQQDRDKADCQNMASAQANSSASWAQIFTGCMSGRGYLVQ